MGNDDYSGEETERKMNVRGKEVSVFEGGKKSTRTPTKNPQERDKK